MLERNSPLATGMISNDMISRDHIIHYTPCSLGSVLSNTAPGTVFPDTLPRANIRNTPLRGKHWLCSSNDAHWRHLQAHHKINTSLLMLRELPFTTRNALGNTSLLSAVYGCNTSVYLPEYWVFAYWGMLFRKRVRKQLGSKCWYKTCVKPLHPAPTE